ncbi:putative methyltransferase-like protein [Eutypa lata UCREL1]|uniref:Putative methyltransferase-like protein n=1 Tax=Eutypa lata (strain UCR-EL1) TaxID=1287681 RepID=M7T262_EUTLA|nr:putative methyltransferase-like protein [Eutypa lata UCREL1]
MSTLIATRPPLLVEPVSRPGIDYTSRKQKGHDISASINYWKDPGDGSLPTPVNVSDDTVTNKRPTVAQRVLVRDITGEEAKYTLDKNAFQLHHHESTLKELDEFRDDAKVKAEYYPESAQLLKDFTGASRVFVFDHRTRCGPSNWHSLGKGNTESRGPLLRAHVDQSYDGAEMVLRRWFPDEADDLVKRRYQIINIWRPIKTILKDPLAVADSSTVPDTDLVAAAIIYPKFKSETWTVRPSEAHRWYFKYKQSPDEVLFIKCFDSKETVARRALHSAFQDPDEVDSEYRESIETRALLFYDE